MKAQFHLPLITYPDVSSFSVIQNAIEFARHHDADLTANVLQVKIPAILQPFPSVLDVDKMRSQAERFSRDNATALTETLRDFSKKAETSVEILPFEALEPLAASRFAQLARAYDLSIMEALPATRPLIESVLFESGRPLLLFPADSFYGHIDTVAIAWDGSAMVSRALTGARLFLERASRAVLISVVDDKPVDESARHRFEAVLRKAGLIVEVVTVQAHGASVAGVIQSAAAETHADLLVAGAYGHSRLREFVLGGVTRSLLTTLEMPVLLAH